MRAYIEDIGRYEGQEVTIYGWLHNRRSSGKIHFLILRDGSGFIQAVMSKAAVGEDMFKATDHLSQETSVIVTGTARADKRAPSGYEIDVKDLQVVGESHDYPITPKEHGVDFLLDRRHLWIRSERQQAILRIRHEIINAVRDFFNNRGFILTDTPIFTPLACEGTTTLFPVEYIDDQKAHRRRAPVCRSNDAPDVYSFGPTFAPSGVTDVTSPSSGWSKPEMAFGLDDVMNLAEDLIVWSPRHRETAAGVESPRARHQQARNRSEAIPANHLRPGREDLAGARPSD
jgi:asparaginyl-tRNA synthetase